MAALMTQRMRRFSRDEDGELLIFALMLFTLMTIFGGIAPDVMKYENTRTALSQTLDRCTLMAASLTQQLDPQDVVEDCVDKAGFGDQLESVTVLEGFNSRDVKATAVADTKPFFLHMIGIDSFDAKAGARAAQTITNVEISLVLDVSGSMAGAKIANLKSAATDFVDTVLGNDTGGRTAISLVPYNGQVNLGSALRQRFNTVDNHGVQDVNCIDLPASVYSTTAMSTTQPMPMTAHADSFSTTVEQDMYVPFNDGWATPYQLNRWCPPTTANVVRMPTDDADLLQGQINGLTAIGATSINAGLKWGLTLLDPASRPMFASLAGSGAMDNSFANRPFAYQDNNTMKVIVLMTDGEHFAEERINDDYRSGISPIWRANRTGEYSIFHQTRPGASKFYVPHLNAWQNGPFNSGRGVSRQRWEEVWANQRVSWVAWQLYARALGTSPQSRDAQFDATMDMLRTKTPTGNMDAQLQQVCNLAKAQDVIIYGIAFEAPENGRTQIARCASTEQHYFNAQGREEIATAFNSIANNLSMLKLTQ